jgi:hypothetical protein
MKEDYLFSLSVRLVYDAVVFRENNGKYVYYTGKRTGIRSKMDLTSDSRQI